MENPEKTMPIAIVGIACRFPQDATDPEKLWNMISEKKSARSEVPQDRFNIDAFYHPDGDRNGMMNNRGGHFLKEDIAGFDAPFFSISHAEAKSMDPMQRILLEVSYEAIENAGIPLSTLAGSDTGCFVGCFTNDYDNIIHKDMDSSPKYHSVGVGSAILSNRISFCFDLKGPSLTLDTACSSSLVGLHLACQSLKFGESKMAIVGATNAILDPDIQVGMTNMHFLSPDSTCYTFDHRANGYARGEGMAAIVLKPLTDAIRDGDTIRAVIRGTAANQDGKTAGITLPSKNAQVALINAAYEEAGCDPALTGYFEAHGTGTQAGDPLEAGAIGETLGRHRPEGEAGKLYVGSVKTNIGHLEGASGLAGLIKATLSVEKGTILPNLWFEKGNPAIDFDGWRIKVPTESIPWPMTGVRRASVNSFGYGGTNGHVIIDDAYSYLKTRGLKANHHTVVQLPEDDGSEASYEDADSGYATPELHPRNSSRYRIYYIGAHEENVASQIAKSYSEDLSFRSVEVESKLLDDLAFTLSERRSRLSWSKCVVANSKKQLIEKLNDAKLSPQRQLNTPVKIGFVFTGQGAQWSGMGKELLVYPEFAMSMNRADQILRELGASWSVLDELKKPKEDSRIGEAALSQPICTAVQVALVDLYASWKILPTKVVGHSSGEIAAAYAAGAISFETAMQVAYFRGLHSSRIQDLGHAGAMMAAGLSEEEGLKRIAALPEGSGKAVVACINSPSSITISGDIKAIVALESQLQKEGCFARKLQVDVAYHSHHMLAVSEDYRQSLLNSQFWSPGQTKSVEMISSVNGDNVGEEQLNADYWIQNLVSPVRFSNALALLCTSTGKGTRTKRVARRAAVDVLIEIGPHSALAGPVKQTLSDLKVLKAGAIKYHSSLIRGVDASATALEVAAALFAYGSDIDIHAVQFPTPPKEPPSVIVDLPKYSWNHSKKYWSESRLSHGYRFRQFPRNDVLGAPIPGWSPMEPTWRNYFRLSEQPWIRSHQVQDTIIYPATGYISMAVEAAMQLSTIETRKNKVQRIISAYTIRELNISRALVIPQSEDGAEVVFSMRPSTSSGEATAVWNEFRVISYSSDGASVEHCRGLVSVTYESSMDEHVFGHQEKQQIDSISREKYDKAKLSCTSDGDCNVMYEEVASSGIWYGPEFRNIIEYSFGGGKAVGRIRIPDTKSSMPKEFEFDHLIHPATLDNFVQMIIPSLAQGDFSKLKEPYIPTFIEEIHISAHILKKPGIVFEAFAEAQFQGFRQAYGNIAILDHDFTPVTEIRGLKCTVISKPQTLSSSEARWKNICGSAIWDADIDMFNKPQLEENLRAALTVESDPTSTRVAELEFLAFYFCHKLLQAVDESEVAGMLEHHQKFYRFMQHHCQMVSDGVHEHQTPFWTRFKEPQEAEQLSRIIDRFSYRDGDEGKMLVRMGNALPSILRQEADPLTVMMEDELLYDFYKSGLGVSRTYVQMARYFTLLSHKSPDLDYLEIGAGTGGATAPVLGALSGCDIHTYPRLKSYTYTDISSGFFEAAATRFSSLSKFIKFRKLDIEKDPYQQGFEKKYDVVIAANVLHATSDISAVMANVGKLLKPGGKLVLLEMTHSLLSTSLIFGNLSGWWMSTEDWRTGGPLLDEQHWRQVLQDNNFSDLEASVPDELDPLKEVTRVMVASVKDDQVQPKPLPSTPNIVIIIPDTVLKDQQVVDIAQTNFESDSFICEIVRLSSLADFDLADKVCISFLELENSLLAEISEFQFALLQSITQKSAGLLWITRGGTPTEGGQPELSLFQGLARSLRAEQESFPCATLDLDFKTQLQADRAAHLIMQVFQQTFTGGLATMKDKEFSELNGLLRVKRIIEDDRVNEYIAARSSSAPLTPKVQPLLESDRPLKLQVGDIGMLETLYFDDNTDVSLPLEDDHVEIEVRAVGLNFRDVLISMGELSDNYLGNECAGVITKVGSKVEHLAPGDRVNAWCLGSFSTSMRNPASIVQRIPNSMSFVTAASLPLVYVTAYYGLVHLGRLCQGESVLIHAAAGGVGQAAIQIAKMIGAEIFVTLGSQDKKDHIMTTYGIQEDHIFSSRDLAFGSCIQTRTAGRGVDVILNSLAGEALKTTWRCIAPFGRFIEIGKKDIESNGRLEMAPFSKNVSFSSVDVTIILRQNLKLGAKLFSEVMDLIRTGTIKEVSPIASYPFAKIEDAFRLMQSGKHIGKIVLEPRENDLVRIMAKQPTGLKFPANGSYLLSGGLGGLGRSISRWMISNGARNLIFVSRSGANTDEMKDFVKELEAAGARVEVLKCDITDTQKLTDALDVILKTMPPIRGVIQGAMVLKDQVFSNMAHDTFINTIRPKVQGSWSLHTATLSQPLDFFVLLSSAAGVIGNAGQSNYVAACTYQVALAKHRISLGLPATAIDIGKIVEVGFIAEIAGAVTQRNLSVLGMMDIHEEEFLAMLELSMQSPKAGGIGDGYLISGTAVGTNSDDQERDLPFWGRDPVFSHLDSCRPHIFQSSLVTQDSDAHIPLPTVLAAVTTIADAATAVLDALIRKLSRSLMLTVEEIDPMKSTGAYGVDSLVAVDIRNWIFREAGADVPVFEVLQSPTLTLLASGVAEKSSFVHVQTEGGREE